MYRSQISMQLFPMPYFERTAILTMMFRVAQSLAPSSSLIAPSIARIQMLWLEISPHRFVLRHINASPCYRM